MKSKTDRATLAMMESTPTTELLIQADGTILAHNLTTATAEMLSAVNPSDPMMNWRARASQCKAAHELPART